MNFNNLFLHSLRKSHCIRPFTSQAAANSALSSISLATPVLEGKKHFLLKNVIQNGKFQNPRGLLRCPSEAHLYILLKLNCNK